MSDDLEGPPLGGSRLCRLPDLMLHKGLQVAGAAATIGTDVLGKLAHEFDPLHEQVLLAQAQQAAGCNVGHTVEARMCRWLLQMRDLTQSDDLKLTQEFLAQMIGVRRTRRFVSRGPQSRERLNVDE